MVPTAQLKVFVPLASFPPRDRERWAGYVADGRGLTRTEVEGAEADVAATRLLTGRSPLAPDAALVRRAGERVLICPLELDLRAAHAFAEFRRTIPEVVVDQFHAGDAPPDADAPAPGSGPHILDEPWAVPLHWFVAFAPDEQRVHDRPDRRGPRLRFLTTVGQAVLRLERAIEIVEATVEDGEDVLLSLAELTAWLDGFCPSSPGRPATDDAVLELDTDRLAALRPPDAIRADRTCAELHEALDALAAGDLLSAAAIYGAVRARWSLQRARHHTS